jgi:carboxyl-terminal processing protease
LNRREALAGSLATVTLALPGRLVASTDPAAAWREEALGLEQLIDRSYAYRERLPDGRYRFTEPLRQRALKVNSSDAMLDLAERALLLLADHHAITGSSFADSWAVVPSYSDLWIERAGTEFIISAVRAGSSAARAGVTSGDRLIAVSGKPVAAVVADFWSELGASGDTERDGFAARVLAAGRRDRSRDLTVQSATGIEQRLALASLYAETAGKAAPVTLHEGVKRRIVFNDSLGDSATIAAFDSAMATIPRDAPVVIDLTGTPSGGNTVIARAIMGWFVDKPTYYQTHSRPVEERATGIARQWVEQVLPRSGRRHTGPVEVLVGRWTGSMGEGLALGLGETGACVRGEPMAGLLGAIEDLSVGPLSGVTIKLPTERLMSVGGLPRESFVPRQTCR